MARYLIKRFLLTLPALWLVLTLVFLMIHIVPGDPVEQMLGEGAAPGQLTQLRHALGLDLPLHTQYGRYLWQLGRGDLGNSFKFQAPVRQIIFERYPATLQLAFLALVPARRSLFLRACLPDTVAARRPTALLEG
jgi:ABC-type dipeptide/oligopeptide/nickel transport system permease component